MLWVLLALFAAAQAYVRLSPLDPERWHVDPFAAPDPDRKGDLRRLEVPYPPVEAFERLANEAQTTPRTRVLAGSAGEQRMTFVTRSAFWGFPDLTTIGVRSSDAGAEIAILARLRFGAADLGVNGKRVSAWIEGAGL
ncbi:DUF1499 domain-containing protein [Celeribacter arenosi]|uniref:DUF1499 domain-containing protein n=1 Tax=Celeribacter arenosi TaxID=792649 RepID=A0ABP7KGU5_9RHOB